MVKADLFCHFKRVFSDSIRTTASNSIRHSCIATYNEMYGNSGRNDMPSLHFKNTPVCWDFLALMFDFFSLSSCCVVRAWHSNLFSKSKSLCRRLPCLPCINYVDLVALTSDLLTVQFLDVWHFEWGNISTTFQVKIRPMCRRLSVVAQRCDANLFRKTLARYGARPLFTRSDPTDRQTDRHCNA